MVENLFELNLAKEFQRFKKQQLMRLTSFTSYLCPVKIEVTLLKIAAIAL